MPHGGYHGNIVGLGQSGTTGGPAGMGSPPPQPKKPTQNVKSLMTSDDAYSTATDTNKKKSTTALTFDDSTPDKGQQSVKSSKELGEKRLQEALEIVKSNYLGEDIDRRLKKGKYGGNLQKSLDAAQKRFNRLNLTDPSVTTERKSKSRALMEKLGIPLQTRNYIYDLFIGGKLGSTERRDSYKPLSLSDFNEGQKDNLKKSLLSAVVNKHGYLKLNSPVVFQAYPRGDDLYHTLGNVSGYINSAGEVIVNDFTDFFGGYSIETVNENTGEIETTFSSDDTSYNKWVQSTIKGTAQILDGTYDFNNDRKVNLTRDEKTAVPFLDRVNNLSSFLVYDVAKALTNLEGTQEKDYPSKVSELKQVAPEGLMQLNLGKVNLTGE